MKKVIVTVAIGCLLAQGTVVAQDASSAASSASSAAGAASGASGASSDPSTFAGLIFAGIKALKALKAKCCNDCPSGQIIKAMTKQLNVATGGLICPGCCPDNPDKNKPSTSAAGACAKIQEDTKDMKKRRDAVKCLAYVDCHWWPEAEAALINALRTDKNECVRLEAALVLQRGCCCTKKIIEALKIVVEASNKDGNPSENSERVRDAAMGALQHCLHVYQEEAPATRPEMPPAAPGTPPAPAPGTPPAAAAKPMAATKLPDAPPWFAYYENVDTKPLNVVLADARRALSLGQAMAANQPQTNESFFVPTGQRSLSQIWDRANVEPAPSAPRVDRLATEPQRATQPASQGNVAKHVVPTAARGQSPVQPAAHVPARPTTPQPSAPARATIGFEELN